MLKRSDLGKIYESISAIKDALFREKSTTESRKDDDDGDYLQHLQYCNGGNDDSHFILVKLFRQHQHHSHQQEHDEDRYQNRRGFLKNCMLVEEIKGNVAAKSTNNNGDDDYQEFLRDCITVEEIERPKFKNNDLLLTVHVDIKKHKFQCNGYTDEWWIDEWIDSKNIYRLDYRASIASILEANNVGYTLRLTQQLNRLRDWLMQDFM